MAAEPKLLFKPAAVMKCMVPLEFFGGLAFFWAAPIILPPVLQCGSLAAGACCSDLGVQHYGMADEIEFLENYKTHVASIVIMMQVQPHSGASYCCTLSASNEYGVACVCIACMLPSGWQSMQSHQLQA